LFAVALGLLWSEHKELVARSRRAEKRVEIDLNLNGERGSTGGMENRKPGII